ncbi:MAG TPA: hypothetical protein VFQ43_17135 [Nitrososphaera sp.]|nr:hypothetical protein [Nitrososphaera sp.]
MENASAPSPPDKYAIGRRLRIKPDACGASLSLERGWEILCKTIGVPEEKVACPTAFGATAYTQEISHSE